MQNANGKQTLWAEFGDGSAGALQFGKNVKTLVGGLVDLLQSVLSKSCIQYRC